MKYQQNTNDENRPWNMAIVFLLRINERLDERDKAACIGDLISWYRINRSIYRNIIFKFRELEQQMPEEKELIELFNAVKNLLQGRTNDASIQKNQISICEVKLDEIDMLLNNLLYRFELIFPKRDRRSIEEIYGDSYD